MLKYFEAYAKVGLQVIPLYANSKIPVFNEWNIGWNKDLCRESFVRYPKSNIGILLGNIVDVEGDTEEANTFIKKLVIDIPHPMYRSSKSTHHLFINPDPNLTAIRFQHIEFRAYKHQSVLPPSTHNDGTVYQWLQGTKFPVPPMPQQLLNFYNKIINDKLNLKPKHIRPWCSVCNKRKYIHQKRFDLEKQAFAIFNYRWQCNKCREIDIREICRKLRKNNNINTK